MPDLLAALDWCPACHGADWEPGDLDLCPGHDAQAEAELELEARDA